MTHAIITIENDKGEHVESGAPMYTRNSPSIGDRLTWRHDGDELLLIVTAVDWAVAPPGYGGEHLQPTLRCVPLAPLATAPPDTRSNIEAAIDDFESAFAELQQLDNHEQLTGTVELRAEVHQYIKAIDPLTSPDVDEREHAPDSKVDLVQYLKRANELKRALRRHADRMLD